MKRCQNNDLPNPNIQLEHICHFSQEWIFVCVVGRGKGKKEEKESLEKQYLSNIPGKGSTWSMKTPLKI